MHLKKLTACFLFYLLINLTLYTMNIVGSVTNCLFLICKSLWIQASAKWINVNMQTVHSKYHTQRQGHSSSIVYVRSWLIFPNFSLICCQIAPLQYLTGNVRGSRVVCHHNLFLSSDLQLKRARFPWKLSLDVTSQTQIEQFQPAGSLRKTIFHEVWVCVDVSLPAY